MENMAIMNIMFSVFAGVVVGLVFANAAVTFLRLSHRQDAAERLARGLYPFVSFMRLGGKSEQDITRRSRHA